jgi:hypothetical protein
LLPLIWPARVLELKFDPAYVTTAERRLRDRSEGLMKFTLNEPELLALLRQDPSARGNGFQDLLLRLQGRLNKTTSELTLTDNDITHIRRYAFRYGNSGWEARLKEIFARHLGPNLDGMIG